MLRPEVLIGFLRIQESDFPINLCGKFHSSRFAHQKLVRIGTDIYSKKSAAKLGIADACLAFETVTSFTLICDV